MAPARHWILLAADVGCALCTALYVVRRRARRRGSRRFADAEAAAIRKACFMTRAGKDYGYRGTEAGHIDSWRKRELPGLIAPLNAPPGDRDAIVYLDYAGASLPTTSQLACVSRATDAAVVCSNSRRRGRPLR